MAVHFHSDFSTATVSGSAVAADQVGNYLYSAGFSSGLAISDFTLRLAGDVSGGVAPIYVASDTGGTADLQPIAAGMCLRGVFYASADNRTFQFGLASAVATPTWAGARFYLYGLDASAVPGAGKAEHGMSIFEGASTSLVNLNQVFGTWLHQAAFPAGYDCRIPIELAIYIRSATETTSEWEFWVRAPSWFRGRAGESWVCVWKYSASVGTSTNVTPFIRAQSSALPCLSVWWDGAGAGEVEVTSAGQLKLYEGGGLAYTLTLSDYTYVYQLYNAIVGNANWRAELCGLSMADPETLDVKTKATCTGWSDREFLPRNGDFGCKELYWASGGYDPADCTGHRTIYCTADYWDDEGEVQTQGLDYVASDDRMLALFLRGAENVSELYKAEILLYQSTDSGRKVWSEIQRAGGSLLPTDGTDLGYFGASMIASGDLLAVMGGKAYRTGGPISGAADRLPAVTVSDDGGATWTEPADLYSVLPAALKETAPTKTGCVIVRPGLRMASGRWVFPFHTDTLKYGLLWSDASTGAALASVDNWNCTAVSLGGNNWAEQSAVEESAGVLTVYLRDQVGHRHGVFYTIEANGNGWESPSALTEADGASGRPLAKFGHVPPLLLRHRSYTYLIAPDQLAYAAADFRRGFDCLRAADAAGGDAWTEYRAKQIWRATSGHHTYPCAAVVDDQLSLIWYHHRALVGYWQDPRFFATNYPAAANVRSGTAYGDGSTGTLDLPAVSDVRQAVSFDGETKTGTLALADADEIQLQSITLAPLSASVIRSGRVAQTDLIAYQYAAIGQPEALLLAYTDADGEAVDLSGKSLAMCFAAAATPATLAFKLTTADGELTIGGAEGNNILIQENSDGNTDTAGVYHWVLRDLSTDGALLEGTLQVIPAPDAS